jgi:hypothetical protein
MGRHKFGNVLVQPSQADLLVLKELRETARGKVVVTV